MFVQVELFRRPEATLFPEPGGTFFDQLIEFSREALSGTAVAQITARSRNRESKK
jgi:hypothetical protein